MLPTGSSRYRIVSRLGQGGMGEVFLAEDADLDRKVALKFLLGPEPLARDERLIREARAVAHLDHPFICKIYEIGEQEGRTFLAMEYVDGATIKERMVLGRIPVRDALQFALEVADALQFAHTRGIVHRDLKPANVMVGADGHVKVMDFGIAKRLRPSTTADAPTAADPTACRSGEWTGTLAYMSPEQIRGEPADHRADVFAFGLLLHEMLAGAHPFARPSALETANAIVNSTPPPLQPTDSGGSPLLAHIAARCLEKDPARRYQSLTDVRLELDSLPGTGEMPAAPASATNRNLSRDQSFIDLTKSEVDLAPGPGRAGAAGGRARPCHTAECRLARDARGRAAGGRKSARRRVPLRRADREAAVRVRIAGSLFSVPSGPRAAVRAARPPRRRAKALHRSGGSMEGRGRQPAAPEGGPRAAYDALTTPPDSCLVAIANATAAISGMAAMIWNIRM